MNDETSLYKYEKKKRDEARADKTIITESIKKILAKIRLKSYTGLTEEEKHIIDEGIISGRVYGDEEYAVHLWKVTSELSDSIFFTDPLYVTEADKEGNF